MMRNYTVDIAERTDLEGVRRLRRAVFVDELGVGDSVEADRFDADADHLSLLCDGAVVGTLRLAQGTGYTGREFDLSALRRDARGVAEIGRMCLHRGHRGGTGGVTLLMAALGRLRERGVGIVVGTASFFGADATAHMPALRALRDAALAPAALRPVARGPEAVAVTGAGDPADMRGVPPLVKTYLRAGAWVGEGAWRDRAFGCVDVCMVLDLDRLRLPRALAGRGG